MTKILEIKGTDIRLAIDYCGSDCPCFDTDEGRCKIDPKYVDNPFNNDPKVPPDCPLPDKED